MSVPEEVKVIYLEVGVIVGEKKLKLAEHADKNQTLKLVSGSAPLGIQLDIAGNYFSYRGTPDQAVNTEVMVELSGYDVWPIITEVQRRFIIKFHVRDSIALRDEQGGEFPEYLGDLVVDHRIKPLRFLAPRGRPCSFKVTHDSVGESFPKGLTFTSMSGVGGHATLEGKPDSVGSFRFRVWVKDLDTGGVDWRQFHGAIVPEPEISIIEPEKIWGGKAGSEITATMKAKGGVAPYTFIKGGSAPSDLVLGSNSGKISWTPKTAGTYQFYLGVQDSRLNGGHFEQGKNNGWKYYEIIISEKLSVVSDGLPAAVVGHTYRGRVRAQGGRMPYKYEFDAGRPEGMGIGQTDGVISWKPTKVAPESVTISASDHDGYSGHGTFSINVEPEIVINALSLPDGAVGESYPAQIVRASDSGKHKYVTFSGETEPPPGLSIVAETGLFQGIPSKAGTFNFYIGVDDVSGPIEGGGINGRRAFTVVIHDALALSFQSAPGGRVGKSFTGTIVATGGVPPYTYGVEGLDGTGLTRNEGVISGTPKKRGPLSFTISVTDKALRTVTRLVKLDVAGASDVGLAISLEGHFVAGSSPATITIKGKVAGDGLGSNDSPARVQLSIRKPDELQGSLISSTRIVWSDKWAEDGWGFTISGIPYTSNIQAPRFLLQANLPGSIPVKSAERKVPFPLSGFFPFANFLDDAKSATEFLHVAGDDLLKFQMSCRHPIDKFKLRIDFPSEVTPRGGSVLPSQLHSNLRWNGDSDTLFCTAETLVIPDGQKKVEFEIAIPIKVSSRFVQGDVVAEISSESDAVLGDAKLRVKLHLER